MSETFSWGRVLEELTFELGLEEQGSYEGKGIAHAENRSKGSEESRSPECLVTSCLV